MSNVRFEIHNSKVEVKEKVVVVEFPIARLAEVITFLRKKEDRGISATEVIGNLKIDRRTREYKETHQKKKIVRRSWELEDVLKAKELIAKNYTAPEVCKDPFLKSRHPAAGIYSLARAYVLATQGNYKNSYGYAMGPKVMNWIKEQVEGKSVQPTILPKYFEGRV